MIDISNLVGLLPLHNICLKSVLKNILEADDEQKPSPDHNPSSIASDVSSTPTIPVSDSPKHTCICGIAG